MARIWSTQDTMSGHRRRGTVAVLFDLALVAAMPAQASPPAAAADDPYDRTVDLLLYDVILDTDSEEFVPTQ